MTRRTTAGIGATLGFALCLLTVAAAGLIWQPGAALAIDINLTGNTKLTEAASSGDVADARAALGAGLSANSRDGYETPVLDLAAAGGHTGVMSLLLEHGALVGLADREGNTAVALAAKHGHTEAVKLLLANRAQAETTNKSGETPLMLAAQGGYVATVQVLLAAGARVDTADYTGRTAVDYAEQNRHKAVTQLLEKAAH